MGLGRLNRIVGTNDVNVEHPAGVLFLVGHEAGAVDHGVSASKGLAESVDVEDYLSDCSDDYYSDYSVYSDEGRGVHSMREPPGVTLRQGLYQNLRKAAAYR